MISSRDSGLSAEPQPHLFQKHLPVIDAVVRLVAKRQKVGPDELDDFRADVHLKLLEENCRVLRGFRGSATLKTFLIGVVTHFLINRREKAWGKWRPCQASKDAGPEAVLLEQWVVRDGLSHAEARTRLAVNHGVALDDARFEALTALFAAKTRRREVDPALLEATVADDPHGETALLRDEQAEGQAAVTRVLHAALAELSKQERFWLRLRYAKGLKIKTIATRTGTEPRTLYRRFEQINRRLRQDLEQAGLFKETVMPLLDDAGFVLHLAPHQEIFEAELSHTHEAEPQTEPR
ncbi:sigma-70 family RNA polymerase sigma factor [Acanthopleuribacter pedis]|uniref:Sigma-70 family RNA polymerase sigma factor n=1 Tax=Acanthopleuribacter pedis TaxID=442870 RepID=A0A8J7U682_9BACT|nr:sigma-70 family RNA polymerase sigma factor [Acanthopleuribacter pedis]MBO1322517.1 sigma-70 family RNA polymerase sigma factor [Acanthopleuribacter pedis]